MKNKGLSVFLSFVLVLVLTVSFSVPVHAENGYLDIDAGAQSVVLNGPTIYASTTHLVSPIIASSTPSSNLFISGATSFDNYTNVSYTISYMIPLGTLYGGAIPFWNKDFSALRIGIPFDLSTEYNPTSANGLWTGTGSCRLEKVHMSLFGQEQVVSCSISGGNVNRTTAYVYFDVPFAGDFSLNDGFLSISFDFLATLFCYDTSSNTAVSTGGFSSVLPKHTLNYGNNDFTVRVNYYDNLLVNSSDVEDQTDTLTSGFDSSSMSSSNTALSGSIAEYTGTESQITDQSVSFIDGVQFYDLNTQPQMLACITFCSSWLQSLFVNIGLWGILVMVSLSFGFGLMLIGWFKYRRK